MLKEIVVCKLRIIDIQLARQIKRGFAASQEVRNIFLTHGKKWQAVVCKMHEYRLKLTKAFKN